MIRELYTMALRQLNFIKINLTFDERRRVNSRNEHLKNFSELAEVETLPTKL